jgi:hypothetical protein
VGRDGFIAAGLLVSCAVLWRQLGAVAANPLVPIGPTFYPRILLGVTGVLAAALLISDLRARRRAAAVAGAPRAPARYRQALIVFGASALYALLLPGIGFVAATILYVGGLAWTLAAPTLRRLPGAMVLAILTAAGAYLVFERYLNVFLPRAAWFP